MIFWLLAYMVGGFITLVVAKLLCEIDLDIDDGEDVGFAVAMMVGWPLAVLVFLVFLASRGLVWSVNAAADWLKDATK